MNTIDYINHKSLFEQAPFIKTAFFNVGNINGKSLLDLSSELDNIRKDEISKGFFPHLQFIYIINGLALLLFLGLKALYLSIYVMKRGEINLWSLENNEKIK